MGLVAHPDQILDRLQEAMNKSGLDDIDIAIVEVNSTIFESDNGNDSIIINYLLIIVNHY